MVMTSDGTRIQILANWPMSHAKRVTRDNRKNLEYHVVVPIRKQYILGPKNIAQNIVAGHTHL